MEQVFAFMSLIINYALARSPTRWVNSAEPPMVGAPAAAAAAMNAPSYLTNDFKKKPNKLDGASTSQRSSGIKVCPFIHPSIHPFSITTSTALGVVEIARVYPRCQRVKVGLPPLTVYQDGRRIQFENGGSSKHSHSIVWPAGTAVNGCIKDWKWLTVNTKRSTKFTLLQTYLHFFVVLNLH